MKVSFITRLTYEVVLIDAGLCECPQGRLRLR